MENVDKEAAKPPNKSTDAQETTTTTTTTTAAAVAALEGTTTTTTTETETWRGSRTAGGRGPAEEGLNPKALYVSYLPTWYTSDDLKRLFSEYGAVERANVVVDRETNESRGFGFVHFADAECARRAAEALSGKVLDGRRIYVGTSRSRSELKLYVAQLLPEVRLQDLEATFARFGAVIGCNIPRDRATGLSRGFGFVHMEARAARQAVQELGGVPVAALSGDQPLVVQLAESSRHHAGPGVGGRGRRAGGSTSTSTSGGSGERGAPERYEGVCVFIYNLPPSMDQAGLRELFHKYGTVLRARVVCTPGGRSKGYGFVNLSTLEEANNAIAGLDKCVLADDKPLQVSLKTERRADTSS